MCNLLFLRKNDLKYSSKTEVVKPAKNYFSKPIYDFHINIIASDQKDGVVETYLANRGIKFKKVSTKNLLDKSNIESRIKEPSEDMKLVKINSEKLDEILKTQVNNIRYCEENYNNYYKDNIDLMIKSGDKIPATTFHVVPAGESVEDSIDYINKFGADRLNNDQLILMFNQYTDNPDHCMFFGMKDLGMDNVPVYINKDTYEIGNSLGLFKYNYYRSDL